MLFRSNFLSLKREIPKSTNLLDNESEKEKKITKSPKKQKTAPKRYYKLTSDLIEKVKAEYPSLEKKHFDNLYTKEEKVFIKLGVKYIELNTDSYCKYSIK